MDAMSHRLLIKMGAMVAIRDVASLVLELEQGRKVKYLFFWGHRPEADGSVGKGCLSQWWPSSLVVGGVEYATAEHFMMAEKARLFGDLAAVPKIVASPHPGAAKALGRGVLGFEKSTWEAERFRIVVRGNLGKFSQNRRLGDYLLASRDRILVEASPRDRIWGIGLGATHEDAGNPARWRGLNLLGFALMEVRDRLASELEGR